MRQAQREGLAAVSPLPSREGAGGGLLVWPAVLLLLGGTLAAGEAKKHAEERDLLLDRDILGICLKTQAGGAKVTAEDLAGRTVLVIFSGPGDAKWNDFNLRMGSQYVNAAPPGGVVTIWLLPGKNTDSKWWFDLKGSPFVSFYNAENFGLPGYGIGAGPRFTLFDADGKLLGDICHDGRDLSGNSVHVWGGTRFTPESVRKTVETVSGAVTKTDKFTECADDMRRLVEGALTAAPLTPVLAVLRAKAKDGRGAARTEAAALLEGFREYLVRQLALIERNVTANPFVAMRALKRILTQLAGDKELAPPFERVQERLKSDKAFQDEYRAAEMLNALRGLAALIQWGLMDPDFPPRPKDKVQAIKQGLDEIAAKFSKTRAAQTAAELKKAYTEWAAKAIDPTPW